MNKKTIHSILAVLVTSSIFWGSLHSCRKETYKYGPARYTEIPIVKDSTDTTSKQPEDTTTIKPPIADKRVCYERDIAPIMASSCAVTNCHDSKTRAEGIDYSSYKMTLLTGEVKPYAPNDSEMYESITDFGDDDFMPPLDSGYEPLTSEKIRLIYTWINEGAKDIACQTINCDAEQIKFSTTIQPMLTNYCNSCHSNKAAPILGGNIALEDWNDIIKSVKDGSFYGSIAQQVDYKAMPPAFKMPDCTIKQTKAWIDAGSLHD